MKCTFTGKEIPPGTGVMYVKKDGKILWFSSSKARKNMLALGRKANKQPWTEEGRAIRKVKLASLKHEAEEKKATKKATAKPAKATETKKPAAKSKK